MDFITEIDFKILDFIRETLSCSFSDIFFKFITFLGDAGILWILGAFILIATKKYRVCGIVMLCGMLFGLITGNFILKPLIARPRPCWINTAVTLLIENPDDYSFPSGHTLSSFISCTVLGLYERKFLFVALPLASLIALSRLYLYVHFPSDVIFAVLYGVLIGFFAYKITEKYIRKAD